MKHHDRPWKCSVDGCEFADGGFLSRNMRDEHLDKYHAANATKALPSQTPLDVDDIQPLLFDLVRADKVDAVREFLPTFETLPSNIRYELRNCAASFASTTMIDMLFRGRDYDEYATGAKAIERLNPDVFKCLLDRCAKPSVLKWFGGVLDSGSEPIFDIWKSFFDLEPLESVDLHFLGLSANRNYSTVLGIVHGNPEKESWVISVWEKVRLQKEITANILGHTLANVARTACSVRLAKYLVDHGADVNYAPAPLLPPIRHAARTDSATAAELTKFLLLQGADPNAGPPRSRKIQDEKGAKSIAKWLGVSWDELVVQTREEGQRAVQARAELAAQKREERKRKREWEREWERERTIQANSATMLPIRAGAETGHKIL
jgi:hypothetical protein